MKVVTQDPDPCMVISLKSYIGDGNGIAVVAKIGELEQTLLVIVPTEAEPAADDPLGQRGGDLIRVMTKPLRKEFPAVVGDDRHILVEKLER